MFYFKQNIFITTLFIGSVFITSYKFLAPTHTPKYYFTLLSLLLIISLFSLLIKK